jgi:SNF2 family DNA or RNA helicase
MAKSNVLLAYDMGTGKTPTTLAAIEMIREEEKNTLGWGTVVTLATLKDQWRQEIEKFTDRPAVVVDGSPKNRFEIYSRASSHHPFGYLVMSYDTYVRDIGHHEGPGFADAFLVLDEATAIKSFRTKRSKAFKKHSYYYDVRLALTGTPVENGQLEEIYSIFEWIDDEILPSWPAFEAKYIERNPMGWITGYRNLDKFHRTIKPYVLRMTADDPEVVAYMPKVVHYPPIRVHVGTSMSRVYNDIAGELLAHLNQMADTGFVNRRVKRHDEEDPDHPDGKLMSMVQTARMLLDHPVAVLHSAARYEDPDTDTGSEFAARIVRDGWLDGLVTSPKMDALLDYLKDFFDSQDPESKVIVFCSFIDVAHQIHDRLPYESVVFTGEMTDKQKDYARNRFLSHPDVKVFVSTDAGGYGLNLPVANLLINYDLPWQPGLLKQRNARIRRASSAWGHVYIQDFVMRDTIEERLRDKLHHKETVAGAAVDGVGELDRDGRVLTDVKSLRSFLADLL